ncbi:hypothetical protein L7F22_068474 [Adiantum nelumboides]|nr:hypothetical protein [Adiantum nelumboides]
MERLAAMEQSGVEVEVDWLEDDEAHTFTFNLPGLRAKDVKVQILNNNTLQVSGVHPIRERSLGIWRTKERPVGPFHRTFCLSGEVLVSQVKAFDVDGLLVVKVPKKKSFARTIPITSF